MTSIGVPLTIGLMFSLLLIILCIVICNIRRALVRGNPRGNNRRRTTSPENSSRSRMYTITLGGPFWNSINEYMRNNDSERRQQECQDTKVTGLPSYDEAVSQPYSPQKDTLPPYSNAHQHTGNDVESALPPPYSEGPV